MLCSIFCTIFLFTSLSTSCLPTRIAFLIARLAAAVADQAISAHAQQRRAAVFLPIVLGINLLHRRLEQLHRRRAGLLQFMTKC
jgi:4-amino-4-deoxy-L-arabinose transferase-like glycosyltransferase